MSEVGVCQSVWYDSKMAGGNPRKSFYELLRTPMFPPNPSRQNNLEDFWREYCLKDMAGTREYGSMGSIVDRKMHPIFSHQPTIRKGEHPIKSSAEHNNILTYHVANRFHRSRDHGRRHDRPSPLRGRCRF